MKELEDELDAIGGNANSLGSGKTREQLQCEIEESNSKIEVLEAGTARLCSSDHVTHLAYQT